MDASWPPPHDEVVAHFDARAASYDGSGLHEWLAGELAALVGALPAGTRVVDVGTGTGLALRALAEHAAGPLELVGVDPAPAMLAAACAALPGLEAVEGTAVPLALPDDSADLVTCLATLWLLPDPAAALREMARVVRPGGRIAVQNVGGRRLRAVAAAAARGGEGGRRPP